MNAICGHRDVVSMSKCSKKQAKEENAWTVKATKLDSIVTGASQTIMNQKLRMKKVVPLVRPVIVIQQVGVFTFSSFTFKLHCKHLE